MRAASESEQTRLLEPAADLGESWIQHFLPRSLLFQFSEVGVIVFQIFCHHIAPSIVLLSAAV